MQVVEGKFIKMLDNIDEAMRVLNSNFSGYLRLSVKRNFGFEEGYIFFENRNVVGYYYSYDRELFGIDAKDLVEKLKNESNCIVEIFEYDDKKLGIMKELLPNIFIPNLDTKKETPTQNIQNIQNNVQYQDIQDNNLENFENLSREELLKKLNIKPPEDNWVDQMVKELTIPSEYELKELERNLERQIEETLSSFDSINNVMIKLDVEYDHNQDKIVCRGNILIKTKKLLGFIKKGISEEDIKEQISKITSSYPYDISFNAKIIVD
jgi:hypothetical protein